MYFILHGGSKVSWKIPKANILDSFGNSILKNPYPEKYKI